MKKITAGLLGTQMFNKWGWTFCYEIRQWIFGIGFDVHPFAFRLALGPLKMWWKRF
jgi:hypothetical protein